MGKQKSPVRERIEIARRIRKLNNKLRHRQRMQDALKELKILKAMKIERREKRTPRRSYPHVVRLPKLRSGVRDSSRGLKDEENS